MTDKLEKLKQLMQIANEGLTKSQFESNFKVILDFVKQLKTANQEFVANLERKYQETVSKLSDNKEELEQAKKEAMKYCMAEMAKMHSEMGAKMTEMEQTMEEGLQDPAQIALEASKLTLEAVQSQLPTLEQLEQRIPEIGGAIRDGLELLPEGEKLKIEAIENLREELDKLERKILGSTTHAVMGGGGVGKTNVQYYDLSASLDGSTKTFTMPSFLRIVAVFLSSAPVLRPTVDWTSDSGANTLTFTSEIDASTLLAAGQSLIVLYAI